MRLILLLAVALCSVVASAPTGAQTTSVPPLKLDPAGLPTIYVRHVIGYEIEGQLTGVTADSVTVLIGNQRRDVAWSDIIFIDKKGDSLVNGALWGLGVSVVTGLAGAYQASTPGQIVGSALVSVGFGVLADALEVGRTRIYTRPNQSKRVSVTPFLDRHGKGLRFSVVF